nr:hypothetical protein [Tanacetum cinerariifolium]
MSRYYPSKDKENITGRRSQVRDLDSGEKFKISTLDVAEVVYCSNDESVKGADENNVETSKQVNLDAESDVEGVSETYFGEHDVNLGNDQDPIGLDTSFPYPPRFTPENDDLNIDVQEVKGTDQAKSQSRSEGLCLRILEET